MKSCLFIEATQQSAGSVITAVTARMLNTDNPDDFFDWTQTDFDRFVFLFHRWQHHLVGNTYEK